MTTRDIINALDRLNIKYTAERVDNRSIEGYSSLFHYKPGTMTFIASERAFEEPQRKPALPLSRCFSGFGA